MIRIKNKGNTDKPRRRSAADRVSKPANFKDRQRDNGKMMQAVLCRPW